MAGSTEIPFTVLIAREALLPMLSQPKPNMMGIATSAARNGFNPNTVTSARIRNAANTMRSPWARLTKRMMPKTRLSPAANSA